MLDRQCDHHGAGGGVVTALVDYWGYLDRVPESERANTEANIEAWIEHRAAVMDRYADVVALADGPIKAVLAWHSPMMSWWFAHHSLHFDVSPSCHGCNSETCGCPTRWPCATVEML